MTKLQKELEIIAALIDGKVVTSSDDNYKWKIMNGVLFYSPHGDWHQSDIDSIGDLDIRNLYVETEPQHKFSIGQEVWFMSGNSIHSDNIEEIKCIGNNIIRFVTNRGYIIFNNDAFTSKQELLDSL